MARCMFLRLQNASLLKTNILSTKIDKNRQKPKWICFELLTFCWQVNSYATTCNDCTAPSFCHNYKLPQIASTILLNLPRFARFSHSKQNCKVLCCQILQNPAKSYTVQLYTLHTELQVRQYNKANSHF